MVDRFTAELSILDILGMEIHETNSGFLEIDVYLADSQVETPELWSKYPSIVEYATFISSEPVENRDWMETYRSRARPFSLGVGFAIDPREPDAVDLTGESGRLMLRIPARTAFGTGEHASTRLVVEVLESIDVLDLRVLDIGTGTGILTLIAQCLGAGSIIAVDIDPVAAVAANENARLNRSTMRVFAGDIRALRPGSTFDLALINMLPKEIHAYLPELADLVPSGKAIFSGILTSEEEEMRRQLTAVGFEIDRRVIENEWCALLVQRIVG